MAWNGGTVSLSDNDRFQWPDPFTQFSVCSRIRSRRCDEPSCAYGWQVWHRLTAELSSTSTFDQPPSNRIGCSRAIRLADKWTTSAGDNRIEPLRHESHSCCCYRGRAAIACLQSSHPLQPAHFSFARQSPPSLTAASLASRAMNRVLKKKTGKDDAGEAESPAAHTTSVAYMRVLKDYSLLME